MARLSWTEAFERGVRTAALLRHEELRARDIAEELGLTPRDVQRMLQALRGAGLVFDVRAVEQERWYRLAEIPAWLEEAAEQLAPHPWERAAKRRR